MQDGHHDWGFGENDFFSFQKLLHQNGLLLLFTKVKKALGASKQKVLNRIEGSSNGRKKYRTFFLEKM